MREAARGARLEARMVRLLTQHTTPSNKNEEVIGKKKSPKTKARMLREIRSYLMESDDDSEEVKEEAAIEKRKGKRKIVEEGRISKSLKKGYYGNPVRVDDDDEDEVRTPPPMKKESEGGTGGTEMLDFAIEMHWRLLEKKVPELRKLCSQEVLNSMEHRPNVLRELRRNPGKINGMYRRDSRELVALYRTCALFGNKKVRNQLKTSITKVVRVRFGVEIMRRPCVKVPFSPHIRLGEVRRMAAGVVEKSVTDPYLHWFIAVKVRTVTKNRRPVGGVIHKGHNHWTFAEMEQARCCCNVPGVPVTNGDIKVRIDQVPGLPSSVVNSMNVTSGFAVLPMGVLEDCIREGVGAWTKEGPVRIEGSELCECYQKGRIDQSKAMSVTEVQDVMRPYRELVAMPIDRNPGLMLLLCPQLYNKACRDAFNRNPSFSLVKQREEIVLRKMKGEFDRRGLSRIASGRPVGRSARHMFCRRTKI
ncbi:hypothetical protein CBR_g39445 [Chara braunii]|uniref:Uncharacterized protein n=1 Tax=Chara braunii TaxID=69332 RepID=A0A388LS06_CHABU|nr:hypothetical protein CBR_g39445 [Chara braunii]|eukprot:GBG84982.1 hypothetical protein CBR_g39445 [Chara braunii]